MVFSAAGFLVTGMATPRISWDVSVSGSLQTGTWLTRWEEVNYFLCKKSLFIQIVLKQACCGEPRGVSTYTTLAVVLLRASLRIHWPMVFALAPKCLFVWFLGV